jgi:hypothetical protein
LQQAFWAKGGFGAVLQKRLRGLEQRCRSRLGASWDALIVVDSVTTSTSAVWYRHKFGMPQDQNSLQLDMTMSVHLEDSVIPEVIYCGASVFDFGLFVDKLFQSLSHVGLVVFDLVFDSPTETAIE